MESFQRKNMKTTGQTDSCDPRLNSHKLPLKQREKLAQMKEGVRQFFFVFFSSFFVTAYGWRVCTCVRNRCVSSTPDIAFAPSGRTGKAHLSHGC